MIRAVNVASKISNPKQPIRTTRKQTFSTKVVAQARFRPVIAARSFTEQNDSFEQKPRRYNNRRQNRDAQQGERNESRGPAVTSRFMRIASKQNVQQEQFKQAFEDFKLGSHGVITPTLVSGEPSPLNFVEFESVEEAQRAMQELPPESEIYLRPATDQEVNRVLEEVKKPSNIIFIKQIPHDASKQQIRDLFPNTSLNDADIVVGNGVAFVKFPSEGEAKQALQVTGYERFSRMKLSRGLPIQFDRLSETLPTVVKIKNAPIGVRISDLRQVFDGLNIVGSKTIFLATEDGTQVPATIFLEFGSPEEAQKALESSGAYIGDRHIRVYMSSRVERRRMINRARELQREQQNQEQE